MMAPRPMLMIAATGDWTKNTPREEYPAVRHIYELYGKPENVETIQIDAEHNYNRASREAMYRFFGRRVLGDPENANRAEQAVQVEKLQDMLALQGRTLPANALSYEGLFGAWRSIARKTLEGADAATQRDLLRSALAVEWPAQVITDQRGERIVLGRAGKGDRVPGIFVGGTGAPVLVVHPDGAEAARKTPQVADLIRSKRPVLLIDAFQTGTAVAPRDRSHQFFLTFNVSDDAARVQDILTGLEFLGKKHPGKIELTGLGTAAIWATFAAAVAPVEVKLNADIAGFKGYDEDFTERFFVPGIQRAGGIEAAKRLTAAYR